MNRIACLDIAKGIGIVSVVIAHAGLFKYAPEIGQWITNCYVPLFFLISGYLYKANLGNGYLTKISNRSKRLLLPYFKYNVLLLFLCICIGKINSIKGFFVGILGILYSRWCLYYPPGGNNIFLFKTYNAPMWFLTCMVCASIIFYIVIDRCLSDKKYFFIIAFVMIVITILLSRIPVLLPWSIDTAFIMCLFMIIGSVLKQYKYYFDCYIDKCSNSKVILFAMLCLTYIVLCNYNRGINVSIRLYGNHGYYSIIYFLIIGVIGSIIIIGISNVIRKYLSFVGDCLSFLGQHTIIILSLHYFIIFMMRKIGGFILS